MFRKAFWILCSWVLRLDSPVNPIQIGTAKKRRPNRVAYSFGNVELVFFVHYTLTQRSNCYNCSLLLGKHCKWKLDSALIEATNLKRHLVAVSNVKPVTLINIKRINTHLLSRILLTYNKILLNPSTRTSTFLLKDSLSLLFLNFVFTINNAYFLVYESSYQDNNAFFVKDSEPSYRILHS